MTTQEFEQAVNEMDACIQRNSFFIDDIDDEEEDEIS